jgi:hypothetical protein
MTCTASRRKPRQRSSASQADARPIRLAIMVARAVEDADNAARPDYPRRAMGDTPKNLLRLRERHPISASFDCAARLGSERR